LWFRLSGGDKITREASFIFMETEQLSTNVAANSAKE